MNVFCSFFPERRGSRTFLLFHLKIAKKLLNKLFLFLKINSLLPAFLCNPFSTQDEWGMCLIVYTYVTQCKESSMIRTTLVKYWHLLLNSGSFSFILAVRNLCSGIWWAGRFRDSTWMLNFSLESSGEDRTRSASENLTWNASFSL